MTGLLTLSRAEKLIKGIVAKNDEARKTLEEPGE